MAEDPPIKDEYPSHNANSPLGNAQGTSIRTHLPLQLNFDGRAATSQLVGIKSLKLRLFAALSATDSQGVSSHPMVAKTLFSVDPIPEEDAHDSRADIGSSFWGAAALRDAVPWPGSTYIIVDRAQGRAITMIDGRLSLESDACETGSCHWVCVENKGWLGFRNTASGKYMGHDGRKNIYAVKDRHQAWEFFVARPCPDGGYLLLTTHYDMLLKMRVGGDGRSLVAREEGGTVWEFIKV